MSKRRQHSDAVVNLSSEKVDLALEDGRRRRGALSRQRILRLAVDVASLEGLNGLSLGHLAHDLELSKSGIQTLFGSKENLQLAAAEFARQLFNDAVVRPAQLAPRGAERMRALINGWIAYAETPLFPGGCFWAANLADFDSRPGLVRSALVRHQLGWRELISKELEHAVDAGEIASIDTDLAAFQVDAVLVAANTAMRLGDTHAADMVRQVLEGLLTPIASA